MNRPIAEPYTHYIVTREKVNQGATFSLMSVAAARPLGVPSSAASTPTGAASWPAATIVMPPSPTCLCRPSRSVRLSPQVMEETRGIADITDAVTRRSPAFDDLMASEDAFEGRTAFAQKRRPRWRNS